ncbi:MAG: adenosylcobinamide amidohydrolase [Thermoproteus sp.]
MLSLGARLTALGNVVFGGDFAEIEYVVFKQVDKYIEDFESYAYSLLEGLGLLGKAAVFFTAIDLVNIRRVEGTQVTIYATVGLSNPACIGDVAPARGGTINLLVVSKRALSRRGLLDLFRTAAEAKAAVLTSRRLCGGRPALGTTSDAILVAAPPGDVHYAGLATEIGAETSFLINKILNF